MSPIFITGILLISVTFLLGSCKKKEGPQGPAGTNGTNGTNGLDANETCKLCHNPSTVDSVSTMFELSKHYYGSVAFEEAGNTTCAPCHEQEGFKYVCKNNTPATFVLSGTSYVNNYVSSSSTAYGNLSCFTCHSSLHTTYGYSDFSPLTTIAAVSMTMWGGAKTINITQDGGISNLCVKCHQPRPLTTATDKNVLNYASLVSNPTGIIYDTTATTNLIKPSYRTGIHYGSVGAIFAGIGGVEFSGPESYSNQSHTTVATCQSCHMAPMTGKAGGHTFSVIGNFNGCNVTECHGPGTVSTSSSVYWTNPRADIKGKLDALAAKLKQGTIEILNRYGDATNNLWYGLTTNNYDGNLNIYDPVNNPDGPIYNVHQFKNPSTSGFTPAQITINNTLPQLQLTNAQMGAIINFQLCLREFSLGIHNYSYSYALLANSIAVLP